MKKRRKKRMVIILVAVICGTAVVTAGYFGCFKRTQEKRAENGSMEVQSAEAKKGTLSQTIVGTGNLELADAENQYVPSGVTISEVNVESGDEVKEGDVLAVLDENSVLDAMEQIQDEISQLDESIQEYQNSDEENEISSSVSGRVKKINVSSGTEVSDAMVSEGALLILSLDGKMEVSLNGVSSVETGDSVTVTLSSGTQISGTVDSVSGDTCTVTVTDDGTVYGDSVTVVDNDGNTLGNGTLTIHQPLAVTGISGTVSTVNVSENDSVSKGTTLLTLEENTNDTEYQELLAKREARTATLKKLIELKENPEIKAEISGTVQSVNVSDGGTVSENSGGNADSTGSSTSSGNTKTVSQMSWKVSGKDNSQEYLNGSRDYGTKLINCSSIEENVSENSMEESFEDGNGDGEQEEETVQDETPENATGTVLQFAITTEGAASATSLVIPAPITGETPVVSVNAEDGTYTGTVSWNRQDENFQEKTVYQAQISLVAADGYIFRTDSISGITLGTVSGVSVSQDGKNMTFQITFPETAAKSETTEKEDTDKNKNSEKENKEDQLTDGSDENVSAENNSTQTADTEKSGAAGNQNNVENGSASQNNSGSTMTAGQSQDSNGTSQTSETQTEETTASGTEISESEYSTDVTAFTISPDDTMILNVSVDELDINSVETGQEAQVTFDAIEGEEFTGKVTKIGNTASVNGGVAKYTVSVSVPKDEKMKQGMNASATITTESHENVVTIPVNALQEKGNQTFVYTKKDEDGNLSGETEVTTGLSDGTTVEITEGLSDGTEVYYNKVGSSGDGTDSSSGMPGDMNDSGDKGPGGMGGNSDSGNGGPGGNGGGPGDNGNSGGNGGGTPPNM